MALSIPKTRWILFLLAPAALELNEVETSALLDTQRAFSRRVQELLKEDGLHHLDLTDESIEDEDDQYLAYLIYCSYVGHGVGLHDIDKDSFRELDALVSMPAGDKFKAVVNLHDLCFEFDKLIDQLDVDLECQGDNLYSLTTNFLDFLAGNN